MNDHCYKVLTNQEVEAIPEDIRNSVRYHLGFPIAYKMDKYGTMTVVDINCVDVKCIKRGLGNDAY